MKQGAYGVSTGLIYSPNAYAKTRRAHRAQPSGRCGRRHLRVAPALRRREAARRHRGGDRDRRAGQNPRPHLPSQGHRREELRPDEGSDRPGRGRAETRRRDLRGSIPVRRQQHGPLADDSAVGARGRRREAGRAAQGSGHARQNPQGDGRPASDVGEPADFGGHVAQRPDCASISPAQPRGSIGSPGSQSLESGYKRYEGRRIDDAAKEAGKDPYDFVFDMLIANARQHQLRVVHHRRRRPEARDAAAVGVDRIRRIGARDERSAPRRRAAPAKLRNVPARARQVRTRGARD